MNFICLITITDTCKCSQKSLALALFSAILGANMNVLHVSSL